MICTPHLYNIVCTYLLLVDRGTQLCEYPYHIIHNIYIFQKTWPCTLQCPRLFPTFACQRQFLKLDSRIVLDCKIHGHACILRDICEIYNFQQSRMNKGEGVPFLSSQIGPTSLLAHLLRLITIAIMYPSSSVEALKWPQSFAKLLH